MERMEWDDKHIIFHGDNKIMDIYSIATTFLGKDSMAVQGEDSAMKRYRSLNMNGDVVAKVCWKFQ